MKLLINDERRERGIMLCYSGNNRVVMLTRTNRKHPEHLEQSSPVPYTIDVLSHTLTHTHRQKPLYIQRHKLITQMHTKKSYDLLSRQRSDETLSNSKHCGEILSDG